MPLYTAVLSTSEYGIVDLVVTYTSLLLPFVLLQVDQALFRFLVDVRKNEPCKNEIISTTFIFSILQMLSITILFSIIQYFVKVEYKWFLLFNVLAAVLENMMLQTARGLGANAIYAFGSFFSSLCQIIGNILLLVIFKYGVLGMLIATITSHVATAFFLFIKLHVYSYIKFSKFSRKRLIEILKYSMPLIPNALSWWAINASDRSIVLFYLGSSFNGLLSIGHKFSTIFITFYNIFNLSWTESAALHINDSDRETFFSDVITNMFNLFMCLAIGIIACMPFVFPILVNTKFAAAYGIVSIFMLASMLNVVVGLYSVVYVALKKTKEVAKTSIYSGLINIVVHMLLIRYCGLYASAISTVVAFFVMAIYRYFDLKKYINVKLPIKYVAIIIAMYSWTMIGYYSSSCLLQIAVLIIDFGIALKLNKPLLSSGVKMIASKFKKR